ncbi:MAG: hypothetical protein H6874_13470 [Hyphomicrobiaceae bacterium]|nr:hypothetical protein [Hyphomicrobiaceae bacterium]
MSRKKQDQERLSLGDLDQTLTPHQRAILDEALRKVTVRSEGQSQEITLSQAIVRKYAQVALAGSPHALGRVTQEIIAAQSIKQMQIALLERIGHKMQETQQRKLDRVMEDGGDKNEVLPHPDDIEIVDGVGYLIVGPATNEELTILRRSCALRDQLLLQSVLEDRLNASDGGRDGTSALVLAQFFNRSLPPRFKQTQGQLARTISRFECMTKRVLLKEAHQGWKVLGRPHPRGYRLPALFELQGGAERMRPLVQKLAEDLSHGKPATDDEAEGYAKELRDHVPA